jgi:membrane-associated phospholipid phosphatase
MRSILAGFLLVLCPTLALAQSGADPPALAETATPVNACDQAGLSTVFTCIWGDVRHIARRESLTWLGAGGLLSAGSVLADAELSQSMRANRQALAGAVGENLGEAGLHFGAAAGLYAIGRAAGSPQAASLGVTLLRAQVVNGILTRTLKFAPRPRPYQDIATTGKGSFPSGHTSASFATATVLQRRFGWKAGVPAYAMATFVGLTRLQNVHYLSDVTFGAALGIASGLTINVPGRQLQVSPLIAEGTTAVSVALR